MIVGLSPMDGVTDAAYREIAKLEGNVDIIFTEFQNVHGLCLNVRKLFDHLQYSEMQRPCIAQIYGHEVEYFYPAALLCFILGFDGVDINMGCPAKKISDRGAGAGLICNPENAESIIDEVMRARKDYIERISIIKSIDDIIAEVRKLSLFNDKSSVELKIKWKSLINTCIDLTESWKIKNLLTGEKLIPNLSVSVKTRIGYDQPNLIPWITRIANKMPDFITIHGRTLKQMYTGTANWDEIRKGIDHIRELGFTMPVLANGDITSLEIFKKCIEVTNADGVLIGRGSYGNPWLFKSIKQNKVIVPTFEEIKSIAIKHSKIFERYKGPNQFFQMRKNLGWYITNIPEASVLRKKLFLTNDSIEVEKILSEYANT